jgi:hypothetical protein
MAMRSVVAGVSMAVLAVLSPCSLIAATAVDHYDSGWGYDPSLSWTISGTEAAGGSMIQAMPFTATASGRLDMWLTVAWLSGSERGAVEVRLDASGQPGSGAPAVVFSVWPEMLPSASDPYPLTPVHIEDLSGSFPVVAGQKYWLKVLADHDTGDPDDAVLLWYFNKIGDKDDRAMAPASLGLLGLGSLGLAALRRRRK